MADEETQLDLELIKKRTISGVVTFTLRTFFIQIFSLIATFILTILLEPSVYGIFFVVSSILNLFVYFSDIGLAAALIQKKEEPNKEDLSTTFFIQQALVFSLVAVGLLFSGSIAKFYKLDQAGLELLRVLIFSLILSSLKTIPSINLERKLNFGRLVVPQIAENIVFYTVAVFLASQQFGISSFTWAVLARGIVGLATIYLLSPWKPSLVFSKVQAKRLSSFGVPFQINSILALIKDDLLTVFLGKILTFREVGYIGWGQKWAFVPLRFFMDNVNKVTFPAYSRLQDHPNELSKAIEKSLFFVTYFVYPALFGIAAIAPKLISTVPNYQKWEPAIPLLYLFAVNAAFSAVSTTFTNTLFAIGRPKLVLNFMIFWTASTWLLTYPLVLKFGYIGVGVASALVASTSLVAIYFAKKEVNAKIGSNIFGPLLISAIMFIAVKGFLNILPQNSISLIIAVIIGATLYFAVSFSVFRKHLTADAILILKSLVNK